MHDLREHFIIESSPDPIVIYDGQGRVLRVNSAFTQIFGWTEDELVGERLDFVPEESQEQTQKFIATILSGERLTTVTTKRLTKDGRIIDIQLSANMVNDDEGNPAYTFSIIRDITDQRRAEKEREMLLQSEHEQRLLAETLTEVTLALASKVGLQAVLDEILIQVQP